MDRCMRQVVSDKVYPPTIGYLTISEIWCSLTPQYFKLKFIAFFPNYLNYLSSPSSCRCLRRKVYNRALIQMHRY
jgi:hypothetical protein